MARLTPADKRLIGVQRQRKAEDKTYRAFEILNLGKYERLDFIFVDEEGFQKYRPNTFADVAENFREYKD